MGDPEALAAYEFFRHSGEIVRFDAPLYSLREQLFFPRMDADAYHFPHYNVPARLNKPHFVTIHDLVHLLVPEAVPSRLKRWYGRRMMRRAADRALCIFTVSEHSRNDIIRVLGISPDRVVLTPNALPPWFQKVPEKSVRDLRRSLELPDRFLLAVGIDKPHKNLEFLLRTFGRWDYGRDNKIVLLICGPAASDAARLRRVADEAGAGGRAAFLPYMLYREMPALYQAAELLVFPSTYEGFGLPVLEAQRVGIPVVASQAASIPEVAGNAALYFDPTQPDELLSCLDSLVDNDDLRCRLVNDGYANEKRFSWDDSARATLDAYCTFLGT
jgi:alpha-1,3-rhamnosyl/mannosyltransferase